MLKSGIHRTKISPDFVEKSVSATTPPSSCLEMLSAARHVTRFYKPSFSQVTMVPFLLAVVLKPFFASAINLTLSPPFRWFTCAKINLHFNIYNNLLGSWTEQSSHLKEQVFCLFVYLFLKNTVFKWIGNLGWFAIWKIIISMLYTVPISIDWGFDCSFLGE